MRGQDVLARLGGDEFTLLLDRIHGRDEAIAIADAGRRRVRRSVRDRRPAVQHLGEHRHRDEPRRLRRRRGAAHARRRRAVPGQGTGPQPHRGVRRRAARVDPAPARRRAGAARRARRGRDRRVVPARGRARAPVASSARSRSPGGRTPSGACSTRGQFVPLAEEAGLVYTLDDTTVRCAVEARAALAARRRRRRVPDLVQRVGRRSSPGPARPSGSSSLLERTGCVAEHDRARDHRDRDPPRRAGRGPRDRGRARARHQGRARRLRHRPLVADAVAFAADRPGEDRPDLRPRARPRRAGDRDRPQRRSPSPRTSGSRSSPRASRRPTRPRCSPSSVASSRRATCGRRRCRIDELSAARLA